jgi:hypothetical protein
VNRRDEIATAVLQGIFDGRFSVCGYNWEYLKDQVPIWIEVAYKTADAAIVESNKGRGGGIQYHPTETDLK